MEGLDDHLRGFTSSRGVFQSLDKRSQKVGVRLEFRERRQRRRPGGSLILARCTGKFLADEVQRICWGRTGEVRGQRLDRLTEGLKLIWIIRRADGRQDRLQGRLRLLGSEFPGECLDRPHEGLKQM